MGQKEAVGQDNERQEKTERSKREMGRKKRGV